MHDLVERWQRTQEAIATAAIRAGRSPHEVRLVAVSKRHPVSAIAALYNAGQRIFGENYVQEARAKMAALPSSLEWHLVGRLQTNKVRLAVGRFALLHGVDSLRLAQALQKQAQNQGIVQPVLVQVNLGREAQKGGVFEEDALALADWITGASHLDLRGLMVLPPVDGDPQASRLYFIALRKLRDRLESQLGQRLPELSMGMSGDFEVAVAEGATLVRIGTRIFGERN